MRRSAKRPVRAAGPPGPLFTPLRHRRALHSRSRIPSYDPQPAGSKDKNKSRLAMRYLLTFHSDAVGQWRCLDTARLPAFRSGLPDDLPRALDDSPDLTLEWMLGRRRFGAFTAAADTDDAGCDRIGVYVLDPQTGIIGDGTDYYGAWLDMFMQQNRPIGWIAAHRPAEGVADLAARAARPFDARNGTCQGTLDRLRDHQSRETAAPERLAEHI